MGVNSLPKTVTRQRSDSDLNPGPSAPESSTLTARLPSHLAQALRSVIASFLAPESTIKKPKHRLLADATCRGTK